MIGPTSRGGSRNDIKKIKVAAMTTPSATPDRSQYVPRRRAATRSSRPTMGRNLMESGLGGHHGRYGRRNDELNRHHGAHRQVPEVRIQFAPRHHQQKEVLRQ